jgi:hypothetical protein
MSATVINLAEARLARGLPIPVSPSEVFAPPAGKRVGDRVFIPSCGAFGIVTSTTPRRSSGVFQEWTLHIDVSGVTHSVGDLAVEPSPESANA